MKEIIVVFLFLILSACSNSVNSAQEKATEDSLKNKLSATLVNNPASINTNTALSSIGHLQFTDTVHNYGNLKDGEVVEYEFSFKNTGKLPVLITEAHGSCGCTVPDYPKEPISPQQEGMIKVTFNSSGKHGHNEKEVIITTNADPSVYKLKILADVN